MNDDLVKELRFWNGGHKSDEKMKRAADRIEKLEEEVRRLVKSRNKWGKLYNQTLEKLRLSVMSDSEYVKIIDEKCAEQADRIEKLEAALLEMLSKCTWQKREQWCGSMGCHCQIARKALDAK